MVYPSTDTAISWVLMGDFNSMLDSQERVGEAEVRLHHFVDFHDCVLIDGLDMRYMGDFLT